MALNRFIRRLLGSSGSKEQAKHRLLTVLVSDRLGLSPETDAGSPPGYSGHHQSPSAG